MGTDKEAALVVNIIKYILSVFIFLALSATNIPTALAQSLVSSVDRSEMSITDTLTLTIKAEDIITLSKPDLTPLDENFDVLNTSVSQNVQYINGESSVSIVWKLNIRPKKLGKIKIPSLELSGEKSNVIEITVNEEQITTNDHPDFSLELLSNKSQVKVNEQFIVTLKFTYSPRVNSLNSSRFDIEDALVERLEDRGYETQKNGREYAVYEIRYAVFAKKAGVIELPVQHITVGLGRPSVFANRPSQTMSMRSNSLNVKVTEVEGGQNKNVLIADNLILSEVWPTSDTVRVGESITREIQMKVEGVLPETIPPISLSDIKGVKIYPEPANKRDSLTGDGLVTERSRRFAMVMLEEGEFVFPAIEIEWWNAKRSAFEKAILAERKITVLPSNDNVSKTNIGQDKAVNNSREVVESASVIDKSNKDLSESTKTVLEKVTVQHPVNYWLIVLVCLLFTLVLVLLVLIWRMKKMGVQKSLMLEKAKGVELQSVNERRLFNQLADSVKQKQEDNIYQCFKIWQKSFSIYLEPQPALKLIILNIEHHIYGANTESSHIEYVEFLSLLKEYRQRLKESNQEAKSSNNDLYPESK